METLKWITSRYNYVFTELVDPRSTGWLFTEPYQILGIIALYFHICFWAGPHFMRNRPPYKLKNVLIAYNAIQIVLNALVLHEACYFMFIRDFDFTCQPSDYSTDEIGMRLVAANWLTFFTKITDLWDTIFFVLRKKTNQVSFLHVYHHSVMVLILWMSLRFAPAGNGLPVGGINSLVHIIMYTYYLISSLGPEYKQYIWWKKYLTQLQLIQFIILMIHTGPILFRDCAYPWILTFVVFANSLLFVYLFGRFYIRSYEKTPRLVKGD